MLFHLFGSQEERRSFGGSAFIEIQFCRMPYTTKLNKIIAVNSIIHWQSDSLYIDDVDAFYQEYSHILTGGINNNLKSGVVDIFGINYYAPASIDPIIEKLEKDKPSDYQSLVEWLTEAKAYNGFYILGI